MRSARLVSGGPAAFGARDKQDFAYRDVGKGREHDCMDVGGRATQEQLPRSGSFANALDRLLAKK